MRHTGQIFITGIDTGVGKTFIASVIMTVLQEHGLTVAGLKPFASGGVYKNRNVVCPDTELLYQLNRATIPASVITPYAFRQPLAPYPASLHEKKRIMMSRVLQTIKHVALSYDYVVVEGIGGVLVPITKKYLLIDVIQALAMPVIVVTHPYLGTLNHTLMTLECLARRNIRIKGIIVNTPWRDPRDASLKTNIAILKKYTLVPVLGTIAYIAGSPIKNKVNVLSSIFKKKLYHALIS